MAPTTTEQVQQVVRIANEHGVPLWTFGQGRNNTYGGPAPRVRGSIIVNLREMNRVLEVNEELCYAVVEPGVRLFDLHDALLEAGGHCWPSIPDLGWGSVIGNTLEYGRGYTPYGDHPTKVCGMEVVLPDGEVLRTGMGGQTDNPVWHAYQHSYGPSLDRLFMQSNFGIVDPDGRLDHARPGGSTLRAARRGRARRRSRRWSTRSASCCSRAMIRNYPIMGRGLNIGMDGEPAIDPSDPTWRLRFALYGRQERVDARLVDRRAARWERSRAWSSTSGKMAGATAIGVTDHNDAVQAGIPDMQLMDMFKIPYGEDTGHLDFSVVGPLTGKDVVETFRLVRDLYERNGQTYLGGLLMSPRNVLHITTHVLRPARRGADAGVYAAYDDMVRRARQGTTDPVPDEHPPHGPRGRPARLQRPHPAAHERAHQGRAGPERDPLAGQVRGSGRRGCAGDDPGSPRAENGAAAGVTRRRSLPVALVGGSVYAQVTRSWRVLERWTTCPVRLLRYFAVMRTLYAPSALPLRLTRAVRPLTARAGRPSSRACSRTCGPGASTRAACATVAGAGERSGVAAAEPDTLTSR